MSRRRRMAAGSLALAAALALGCDGTFQPPVRSLSPTPKPTPTLSIAPTPTPSPSLAPLPPDQFGLSGQVIGANGPIPNAFLTLLQPDGKFYVDAVTGKAFSATSDAQGAFRFPITDASRFPFNQDVIVEAQLPDNQRLSGYMIPSVDTPNTLEVDLATTLATELLRGEAQRVGKVPGAFDMAKFKAIVQATDAAIGTGALPKTLDLRADHAQDLRNQATVLMTAVAKSNTALQALSDQWKGLIGHRPMAVTTLLSEIPGVSGVAVSQRGDVFLAGYTAEPDSGQIRWIRPDGGVTAVRLSTYKLKAPEGLAIEQEPTDDPNAPGTLLVADAAAHRVYRVPLLEVEDAARPMAIVAGEDRPAFDAATTPAHPLYKDGPTGQPAVTGTHARTSRWRLTDEGERRYRSDGTAVATPARYAHLNHPTDVAVDERGHLYIADRQNHRLRMVPARDGSYFGYHQAFDDDSDGVPDRYDVAPTPMKAGCIYTIAGNPRWDTGRTPASEDGRWFGEFSGDGARAQLARLDQPVALAFRAGHLYVSDRDNQRVRKIARDTGLITTVVGRPIGAQQVEGTHYAFAPGTAGDGGQAIDAQLANPRGIALDARGRMFVSDADSGRLRMVNTDGVITTVAGRLHPPTGAPFAEDQSADGLAIGWADLFQVAFLEVGPDGNVVFTDQRHRRARQLWFQWE